MGNATCAVASTVYGAGTAKICCSQTEILLPLKIKLLFSAFLKIVPQKIVEFIDFKAKKILTNQNY